MLKDEQGEQQCCRSSVAKKTANTASADRQPSSDAAQAIQPFRF